MANSKTSVTNIPTVNSDDIVVARQGENGLYIKEIKRNGISEPELCLTNDRNQALSLDLTGIKFLYEKYKDIIFLRIIKSEINISDEVHYLMTGENKKICETNLSMVDGYEISDLIKNNTVKPFGCGCGSI